MRVTLSTSFRINKVRMSYVDPVTGRETLIANRTYYVRTDGSDTNDGLTNTSGGAFATIQKAVDSAVSIDPQEFFITIQLADGTYNQTVFLPYQYGKNVITITGNASVLSAVIVNGSGSHTFLSEGWWKIQHVEIRNETVNFSNIFCQFESFLALGEGIVFGAATTHVTAYYGGQIYTGGDFRISGNATYAFLANFGGFIYIANDQCIFVGSRTFSGAFIYSGNYSTVRATAFTYSGTTPTCTRYIVTNNSVIQTANTSTSYFPGNVNGSASNGGMIVI
jgi:hypothetical protein